MSHSGHYANGDEYGLPADWSPLNETVLGDALNRALEAANVDAVGRLAKFYDRDSEYAGTSFLGTEPNPPDSIVAADLYAVSRLSITVTNLQGRLLLDDTACVTRTKQLLAAIPHELTITELDSNALGAMWSLQHHFRTLLATDAKQSSYWVFAAKLCARKRPALFPVRDSVVCRYLSGGQQLAGSAKHAQEGRLGWFSSDIQAFAYIASDHHLRKSVSELRNAAAEQGVTVDDEFLRVLDVLLWTRGMALEP